MMSCGLDPDCNDIVVWPLHLTVAGIRDIVQGKKLAWRKPVSDTSHQTPVVLIGLTKANNGTQPRQDGTITR
jgi:hypothetical protein